MNPSIDEHPWVNIKEMMRATKQLDIDMATMETEGNDEERHEILCRWGKQIAEGWEYGIIQEDDKVPHVLKYWQPVVTWIKKCEMNVKKMRKQKNTEMYAAMVTKLEEVIAVYKAEVATLSTNVLTKMETEYGEKLVAGGVAVDLLLRFMTLAPHSSRQGMMQIGIFPRYTGFPGGHQSAVTWMYRSLFKMCDTKADRYMCTYSLASRCGRVADLDNPEPTVHEVHDYRRIHGPSGIQVVAGNAEDIQYYPPFKGQEDWNKLSMRESWEAAGRWEVLAWLTVSEIFRNGNTLRKPNNREYVQTFTTVYNDGDTVQNWWRWGAKWAAQSATQYLSQPLYTKECHLRIYTINTENETDENKTLWRRYTTKPQIRKCEEMDIPDIQTPHAQMAKEEADRAHTLRPQTLRNIGGESEIKSMLVLRENAVKRLRWQYTLNGEWLKSEPVLDTLKLLEHAQNAATVSHKEEMVVKVKQEEKESQGAEKATSSVKKE